MDDTMRLFVAAYAFAKGEAMNFLLPGKEITIEGANGILPALLQKCTGYRAAEEIVSLTAQETGYALADVWTVVNELMARQILVDATQHYLLFHVVSANPMPFAHRLSEEDVMRMVRKGHSFLVGQSNRSQTPFEELLERRESTREFTGEPLSQEEIQQLAWTIYGKTARSERFPENSIGLGTVPSGGALYPLRLFVLTPLQKGTWQCLEAGTEGLIPKGAISHQELAHGFLDDPEILKGVGAVYVLACDFLQTTQKYANRGYRYALLEAGHAAQNAYLWCAEQNLGVVEIGGFADEKLANLLSLSYPQQAPLTTLIVGRRHHNVGNA